MPDEPTIPARADFPFPIVAVGASAGGIEALKAFFSRIPEDAGAAFVVLQHLSPDYESQLTQILGRAAALPTMEAEQSTTVKNGHIYVLPPDRYLRIVDHGLFVEQPAEPRGLRMPIDYFMRSLAETAGDAAVGVILSGTGSDGALGLREIQGAGGLTFVQLPETALYDGMPRAALATGGADFVASIEQIVEQIVAFTSRAEEGHQSEPFTRAELGSIVNLLKLRFGHDFGAYKSGTIARRVRRRMNLLRLGDLGDYLDHLKATPNEVQALFEDMLINVTAFFRDRTVWDEALTAVIDPLLERESDAPLRVWVPACSTGEEAYSLAMMFDERARELGADVDWQIFATDLDADAVSVGRAGIYPASIEIDVSADRLSAYFRREEAGYRVEKRLRERVVFAQHNVLIDPPFSKLDLISCRNLLIYLDSGYQSRLVNLFHFALNEDGFLILGTSETTGQKSRDFATVSARAHIYRRLPGRGQPAVTPRHERAEAVSGWPPMRSASARPKARELAETVRRSLLSRFTPASVAITPHGRIAYYHGPIRRFIDTPEGEPTDNVYDLLAPALKARVREVTRAALGNAAPDRRTAQIQIQIPDGERPVRLEAEAIGSDGEEPLVLVSFVELANLQPAAERPALTQDEYTRQLENEVVVAREDLQTTVEELETANEELKASNEEAMATNEELQSTNEELETSREELQSLNEELITVNNQLEEKIREVEKATDDIRNLFMSTRLPVIFLDGQFRISSFTPSISKVIDLRRSDIGRPLTELALKVDDPSLLADCEEVLRDLAVSEREIVHEGSQVFLRRVQPYRTGDERIGGVVVTYTDITQQAKMSQRLAARERQQRVIAELGQTALAARDETAFLNDLCAALRIALSCDFAKVLVYDQQHDHFSLAAGIGWKPGLVGTASVHGGLDSQAGFTFRQKQPVLVLDRDQERRFSFPRLLLDHDVRSGVSTVIFVGGKPWGVLGLHDRRAGHFEEEDITIVRAAANIVSATVMQITRERKLARDRVTLELAINAAKLSLWYNDPRTDDSSWDVRLYQFLGQSEEKMRPTGERFFQAVHEEDREAVRSAYKRTTEEGQPFDAEFRIRRPDGTIRWLAGRGERIVQDGITTIAGVNYDVTERREAEERQAFVARELDHRVKNILAIIVSIARVTAGSSASVAEFCASFNKRLEAMARTHSLLAEARWQGATIRTLLEEELFQYSSSGAIALTGPEISVRPTAAQSLSMAIHELATNAAKYGALSRPEGRLDIAWSRSDVGSGERIRLEWRERGGPAVVKPQRRGFGTTVLTRMLTAQLNATADLHYEPDGLRVLIEIPIEQLVPRLEVERAKPGKPSEEPAPIETLSGRKVLVLDDEWLIADQNAAALANVGAEIIGPFTDLETAREAAAETELDLAVLDYNIDGSSVLGLARELAAKNIPILVVTGYGSSLELPSDFEFSGVIHKPATLRSIISRSASILWHRRQAGEIADGGDRTTAATGEGHA